MLRQNNMGFFKFCIQNSWAGSSVTITYFSIQSPVPSNNSIGEKQWSFIWFLDCDLHSACKYVGVMLQSTIRWKAFFSWIFPTSLFLVTVLFCIASWPSALNMVSPASKPSGDFISPFRYCPWSWSLWTKSFELKALMTPQLDSFKSFLHIWQAA